MKIKDLGELTGQVLAFGGPVSNLQATQALIAKAHRRGIAATNCICTGDLVAYCADPAETVSAIRTFGCPTIAGNMERQLGAGAQDCGCGFEAGTACDLMSGAWFAHASKSVGDEDRAWMRGLPDWIRFSHLGRTYLVIHGGGSDVSRFLWPTSRLEDFAAEWQILEREAGPIDVLISGHSGVPFIHHFSFGDWVNAGVIGMPPNDGDPRMAFALIDSDGTELHRLEYAHDDAARAMEAVGLTQGYERSLRSGYWPSEDVLPSEMRRLSPAKG